jgi:hypothetical protein
MLKNEFITPVNAVRQGKHTTKPEKIDLLDIRKKPFK